MAFGTDYSCNRSGSTFLVQLTALAVTLAAVVCPLKATAARCATNAMRWNDRKTFRSTSTFMLTSGSWKMPRSRTSTDGVAKSLMTLWRWWIDYATRVFSATLYNLNHRRVQLQRTAAHVANNRMLMLTRLQMRYRRRLPGIVHLDVVSVQVRAQAETFNHCLYVRRVRQLRDRSNDRALRYSVEKLIDGLQATRTACYQSSMSGT
jgi:hypothetical protein